MNIGIEVNGVLRDTVKKFKAIYEKTYMEEFDGEGENLYKIKEPIDTEFLPNHFYFENDEELFDFTYVEFPMSIFGHAPSTHMDTFVKLNELYTELRDDNNVYILSDEIGKSKPSTLFFLSKFGCEVERIMFYNTVTKDEVLTNMDVLITASSSVVEEYKNQIQTIILFNTEQNMSYEYDKRIDKLEELTNFILKDHV